MAERPETPRVEPEQGNGEQNGGHKEIERAARRAVERDQLSRDDPEPSLGARLGQIGILGWAIVAPILLAILLGRFLDRSLATGIFFTAPLIFIGAGIGFHAAWKWMHSQ
ncbi:AtpZ/AtpI family protein [Celeribacter neptunius]|uniref:ATP synthase protein I n=1 Tax=Celeribacter neptunius TaxID=588602 RepID=A0A1I3NUM9_9RHOB|nr:AtpZ/AtpI family protein [Celeribacter neptunius]SFJ12832.1 ATP synthase protein I [Celeribacter neptunius]